MKELTGNASARTPASSEACLALLAAVDRYPDWYPEVVKSVEVLERDAQGRPTKARTMLHVQHGPITRDFDLTMEVTHDPPGAVRLNRIPHDGRDGEKFEVNWLVRATQPTEIRLDLAANLDVPRFVPLGGIGESMASGFVSAATRALASS
jgi:Polyketide cyclase / dehydrase and lipid transport